MIDNLSFFDKVSIDITKRTNSEIKGLSDNPKPTEITKKQQSASKPNIINNDSIAFTMSPILFDYNICGVNEYGVLIAGTYGDNLYAKIDSELSSYFGVDITDSTDIKKYINSNSVKLNIFVFEFDDLPVDITAITVYDRSSKFTTIKTNYQFYDSMIILHEPLGIAVNDDNLFGWIGKIYDWNEFRYITDNELNEAIKYYDKLK